MAAGGKRAGAGRKPSTIKGLVKKLGKFDAEALLSKINGNQKWIDLASCGEPRVELEVMKYLTDRAYGKVTQPLDHSGRVTLEQLVAGANE
jgi:hypothetical protein